MLFIDKVTCTSDIFEIKNCKLTFVKKEIKTDKVICNIELITQSDENAIKMLNTKYTEIQCISIIERSDSLVSLTRSRSVYV